MGNRVSNLWCKKTNLAIKDKEFNENTKVKRESKRRFRQRRLSLNCITREPSQKASEEPVLVHKPSASLPRHTKLSTPERNFNTAATTTTTTTLQPKEVRKEKEEVTTNLETKELRESQLVNENLRQESKAYSSLPPTTAKELNTEQKPVLHNNSIFNTNSFGVNLTSSQPRLNSFTPISSTTLSSPSSTCSNATIDVVDSPIRVLATTKTQDILTSEKLTCTTSSISSLKTKATMKFNSDLTTVKVSFKILTKFLIKSVSKLLKKRVRGRLGRGQLSKISY
ncbi:uncharacterized protein LOC119612261 [Lucilia sericata]|uniref:uncharacterized protein LOC119612261 n=1 Tax=Lucilia sericata TaxID=13632 RepID=UPI0018A856CB|nr:uncharacterized protein LOC119612261 [Lucilia sericata]